MRFRRPTTIQCSILCAAALTGCRSGGDLEALKRENFQLTEQVTALEVRINQCCRELHATRDLLAAKEQPERSDGSRRVPRLTTAVRRTFPSRPR